MRVKFEVGSFHRFSVLELLAFNAQKFRGHVTLATPPFGKRFFEGSAFNAQKFRGHVTLTTPPFGKISEWSCPDCPWEHMCQI